MTLEEPEKNDFDANLDLFHLEDKIDVEEEPFKRITEYSRTL